MRSSIRRQLDEIRERIEARNPHKRPMVIVYDYRDVLNLDELIRDMFSEDKEVALKARSRVIYLIDENFDYESLFKDREIVVDKLARGLLRLVNFEKTLKGLPRVGALEKIDEFFDSGIPQVVSKAR